MRYINILVSINWILSLVQVYKARKKVQWSKSLKNDPKNTKKALIYKAFSVRVQNWHPKMAPRTGLEPVTRQIQTSKFVRTYRGRHGSRIEFLRAKIFCFKNSCFVPLTEKNSHSGYFFPVNYQLRNAQSVCKWYFNHDVTGSLLIDDKKKRPHSVRSSLFGSPDRAWTCDIMINSHALYRTELITSKSADTWLIQ